MTFQYSSDCSLLVYLGEEISLETHRCVLKLLRLMEADPPPGLRNLHPAYCSLLVVFDPVRADHAEIRAHLLRLAGRFDEVALPAPRRVEIPVCYGGEYGPDLEDVAAMHGLTPERVVELHSSAEYVVYFLGFTPGYPYLGGLPKEIVTPRLPQPRRRVPAGSVGIAGSQSGIYPFTTPGGWRILGRTSRVMFDAGRDPMSLLEIGDVVRFRRTDTCPAAAPHASAPASAGNREMSILSPVLVEAPGMFTTVQDLGRAGYGPMGVSPSGAADPESLILGNRLAGNPDNAAALELTLLGGTFAFPEGGVIALAGSDFGAMLDGRPLAMWTAHAVRPGQSVKIGATRSGARCYLCVRGGIDVPPVLGSRSTHLVSGLGGFEGRPLRKGDVLPIGPASGLLSRRTIPAPALERLRPRKVLRVTAGPQAAWFSEAAVHAFYQTVYRVSEEANRMGLRLEGPPLETSHSGQLITEGVPLGAVQVPAGGSPIILFVEQQTTGGYPKIANVISADLPSLGQLRPRDEVRFELVEPAAARALIRERSELLGGILK